MEKLLLTADWQATLKNLPRCRQALEDILSVCSSRKVSTVVHLGDLKDDFNPVDQRVTNFLVAAVRTLMAKGIRMICLLGNHDRIGVSDQVESCLPVLQAAGAMVIDKPTAIGPLHFVPYYRDEDQLRKALRGLAKKATKECFLFFHSEIRGCRHEQGYVSSTGFPISEFPHKKYAACFGGHIHFPQQIPSTSIWYVGSPFPHRWDEANQRKRYLLVGSDEGLVSVETIYSSLPGWYDPAKEDYSPPESWVGAKVKVHAESLDWEKEKEKAKHLFPGAEIIVEPKKETKPIIPAESDLDLVRFYVKNNPVPEGYSEKEVREHLRRVCQLSRLGFAGRRFRIRKIVARNALSYRSLVLDFTKPPLDRGLVLLSAENRDRGGRSVGSGKTNLFQMLCVGLFGRTAKGQTHDRWVRKGAKKARVSTYLTLPSGQRMVIRRTRKPQSLSVTLDGKMAASGTEAQRVIEDLLGTTWELLVNTLYVDQMTVSSLLAGTDSDRKKLVGSLLGVERMARAQEELRGKKSANTKLLDEMRAQESQASSALHELSVWKVSKEVSDLEEKITKLRQQMAELEALAKQSKSRKSRRDRARKRTESAAARCTKVGSQIEALEGTLRRMPKGEVCPVCRQRITVRTHAHRREIEQTLNRLRAQRDRLMSAASKCRKREGKAAQAFDNALQADILLSSNQAHLKTLETQKALAQRRASEMEEKIDHWQRIVEIYRGAAALLEQHLTFLAYCQKALSKDGILAYMADHLCSALNSAVEKFFTLLSDGTIKVAFRVDPGDGKIDVTISNPQGGDLLQDQSGGELRTESLIVSFAIREISGLADLLILDEPGDKLDAEGIRELAEGLRRATPHFGTVLVATHNILLQAELEKEAARLHIVKEKGVSSCKVTR